jgi:hypothetical protein
MPNIQIQDRSLSWLGTGISTKSGGVLNGVRVTRSLVLCVCLVDRCLSNETDTASFNHL